MQAGKGVPSERHVRLSYTRSLKRLVGRRLTPAGPISPVSVRTTKTSSAFSKMAKNNARLEIEFFSIKVSPTGSNCEGISPNLGTNGHSLIGVSD